MERIEAPPKLPERHTSSTLEVLDVETGERKRLAHFDDVIEAPNWTMNDELIFNRDGKLYAFGLAGSNIREIDTGFATCCNNDHVLSPDHSHIAFSHHPVEDRQSRIYIVPMTGGDPVLVTPMGPSYLHGWSPDGKLLAYCAERDGQYDVYTIPAKGGEETQLTDLPGLDDGPEFSPDGTQIWFNSTRSGLMQIWRMNVDGSGLERMTFEESNNWFPHVSPDGSMVVYLSYMKGDVESDDHPPNKHVELRLTPASGGPSRTIAKLFGGQGTINVNSWSPDSKRIAFISYTPK